jgi:biopolymer transport protein ExbD
MTLHDLRWAYIAARASVYALLLVLFSWFDGSVGVSVYQPSVLNGRRYAVRNDDVVVTVQASGELFAAHSWVPAKDLAEELQWLREHNPHSRFVLRADRDASFGMVRNVLRAARDAGWRRITVEGQPPTTLLERRIHAGWALPRADHSALVERPTSSGSLSLDHMWR